MKPILKKHADQIFLALKLYRERKEWTGFHIGGAWLCLETSGYKRTRDLAWLVNVAIRRNRFTKEDGSPRFLRVYDNGGETADRYTIVFTGRYRDRTMKQFWYLNASENPYSAQGVGLSGESERQIDYPTYGHLGKKIQFKDLPEAVQRFARDTYNYLWDLDPCLKCRKTHDYHDPRCPVRPARSRDRDLEAHAESDAAERINPGSVS